MLANRIAQQQQRSATSTPAASPAATILKPGQPSAQECFQHLQRSTANCRNAMMEIAYYGFRLRQADSWAEIGLADEESCREYLGIPEATWDKYVTLGERLQQLTLDDLRSLSMASAQWLTRVNPKIWGEFPWIEEARLLSATNLAALVAQRNGDIKLLAAKDAVKEGAIEFKFKIAPGHMRPFKQRLEKLRQAYDVRSVAEALERALDAAEKELAENAKSTPEISPAAANARD